MAKRKVRSTFVIRKVRSRDGKVRVKKVWLNPNKGVIYPGGNKIKALRKQLGMLQKEFAKHLQVTTRTVSALESGRSRPGPETQLRLNRLARAHGLGDQFPGFSASEIVKLRRSLGLSTAEFAHKLGMLERSVLDLEQGISKPTMSTIKLLVQLSKSKANTKKSAKKSAKKNSKKLKNKSKK